MALGKVAKAKSFFALDFQCETVVGGRKTRRPTFSFEPTRGDDRDVTHHRWTGTQLIALREMFAAGRTDAEIAAAVGVRLAQVIYRRRKLSRVIGGMTHPRRGRPVKQAATATGAGG